MLLMLVSLLCCVPAAKTCLQCDRRIVNRQTDYFMAAPYVKDHIDLKKILDHTLVTYRVTSQQRRGVIDPTTLYRVRTEYRLEFDRFLKTPQTLTIRFAALRILVKGTHILKKHLDKFIRNGLCPNKCGLLKRRVLDCLTCRYRMYICPSPSGQLDCGARPVQAEEGDQAVLNCFLPWHRLLPGGPEYHYSWAPGVPGTEKLSESDFKALVVTDDSSVVLNQVHAKEQGTYRCSLQDRSGTVFYKVSFLFTVVPLPDQTHLPVITRPSLPHRDNHSPFQPTAVLLVPVIATVTALSLAASVGLAVVLGMMMSKRRAAEETRRRRKEGKNTQNQE